MAARGDVVISEIMYHPASHDDREEFIELHNRGEAEVSLKGWRLGAGVEFVFSETRISAGGRLVVAADPVVFREHYPASPSPVGPWKGRLSNTRETIELRSRDGDVHCRVTYADEGDWATRVLGAVDHGYRGWEWRTDADGGGGTIELINSGADVGVVSNWAVSKVKGGTPGSVNSVQESRTAPLISEVEHLPIVPRSQDRVVIRARCNEGPAGVSLTLHFRMDGEAAFGSVAMADDGLQRDLRAGDGVWGAELEPFPHGTVVEFFVEARDEGGRSRTWPAPALVDGAWSQSANALFQVEDRSPHRELPEYRIILTASDSAWLRRINAPFSGSSPFPDPNPSASHAQFNATWISIDGDGIACRYGVSVRNRGNGSQARQPQSFRINFRSDEWWNGVEALNLNGQNPHLQVLAADLYHHAGMVAQHVLPVSLRWNGAAVAISAAPSHGFHAASEVIDENFAGRHFPGDGAGNVYRGIRVDREGGANLRYQGEDPDPYRTNYFKQTRVSEDQWGDLIELTRVLHGSSDAEYAEAVRRVLNVDALIDYFAVETLLDNKETNLANANNGAGAGDDYFLYRGVVDRRFRVIPYDLDTILGGGDTPGVIGDDLFRMAANPVMARFMRHPEFCARYYQALDRLMNTTFSPSHLTNAVERMIGGLVPGSVVESILAFNAARTTFVRSRLPREIEIQHKLPMKQGYVHTSETTVALAGTAPAGFTVQVRVNGESALWNPLGARWEIARVPMAPGLNSVLVLALDKEAREVSRRVLEVWAEYGSGSEVSGLLGGRTVWKASQGPFRVAGNVRVPAGAELVIEPGVSVYLDPGVRIDVEGRLGIEGRPEARVRLSRPPGSLGFWGGIFFSDAAQSNRIVHADLEFGGALGQFIRADRSELEMVDVRFAHANAKYLELQHSSFRVADCHFPGLSLAELIHGEGIKEGGRAVIEGNHFGGTSGLNDIIDFSGGKRPGPILEVLNNVFTGASDDILDLDGADAWVEGNVFAHAHQSVSVVDTSSAVSGGWHLGNASEILILRNYFLDCDHMAMAKEGNFYTLLHNTALRMTKSGMQFDEPGRRATEGVFPGRGAWVEGNIVWQTPVNFEDVYVDHPQFGTTVLTVRNNLLSGTNLPVAAVNTLREDPLFIEANLDSVTTNTLRSALRLRADSPALGMAAGGLNLGADVPRGPILTGGPSGTTWRSRAAFRVVGPGFIHYRYRLDQGAWSEPQSMQALLVLEGLSPGPHQIRILARDWAGRWMREEEAVVSEAWRVDPGAGRLRIHEVGAAGSPKSPEFVELFNDGPLPVLLDEYSLSDDEMSPGKMRFPAGLMLKPEEIVSFNKRSLSGAGAGAWTLSLDRRGDSLRLFRWTNGVAVEWDAVEFGAQLEEYSAGRDERGTWGLHDRTPGKPNQVARVGSVRELRLNEWKAGTALEAGFVELFNPSRLPVDLGGCWFSDAPAGRPDRTRIRDLTFLEARGRLTFSSDPAMGGSRQDLGFDLSHSGGQIALFDPRLEKVDGITFGAQRAGISEGRSPDGAESMAYFNQPTPGSGNPMIRINRSVVGLFTGLVALTNLWSYETRGLEAEAGWRNPEFNDSTWPVQAGVLYANPSSILPAGASLIPATGTTAYFRSRFSAPSPVVEFPLQAEVLVDDGLVAYLNGVEILRHGMPSGPISSSTPAARRVATASLEGPFELPKRILRAGENTLAVEVHQAATGSSDLVFGLALKARQVANPPTAAATQVILNEVYPAPGVSVGWIELHNPSTGTLDLSGLSLSDDTARPRRYVIPAGQRILPGGYWTVQCDGSALPSEVNTGFGLKASGGVVLVFDRPEEGSALLDSVRYGLQTTGFSLSRLPNAAGEWKLGLLTSGAANVATPLGDPKRLKINEWMASPTSGDDWLELYNPNSLPVDLGGMALSDDSARPRLSVLPALSFIGTGTNAFVRFEADDAVQRGGDHLAFRLSASGETLVLSDASGAVVDQLSFGSQRSGISQGRLPDGSATIISFPGSGTPGTSNFQLPPLVINEVLAHTDPPLEDAVEIYNPTSLPQDIGGWFLSDSDQDLKKFKISAGTVVPAQGYVVFYGFQLDGGAGSSSAFTLNSAHGDEIYLSAADAAGNLTGFRVSGSFGASANGVSFARYPTSAGFEFVPSSRLSFGSDDPATLQQFRQGRGAANAPPLLGPIGISEIHYHPPARAGVDNVTDEFVELWNRSSAPASLFDPLNPDNRWKVNGGVGFTFPANVTLAPDETVLLVNFDPATSASVESAFRSQHQIPATVRLFGPLVGKLGNSGDEIGLYKPDPPQLPPHPDAGFVPYVLVERLVYLPGAPWPLGANGTGQSIHRVSFSELANEPLNWRAATPSPGKAGTGGGAGTDSDGDGLPNAWESAFGLDPLDPSDALSDRDGDGLTALQEFRVGTDPRNGSSVFRLESIVIEQGQLVLRVRTGAVRAVVLESAGNVAGPWNLVGTFSRDGTDEVGSLSAGAVAGREKYFRILARPE